MGSKFIALCTMLLLFNVTTGYAGIDEAKAAYDKGDFAASLQEIRPLAEQGIAAAQNLLGIMYANGQGVPQDYLQATAWFSKAAEQGYIIAQSNLGAMYGNGQGVPQDYEQAIAWYRKAAEKKYAIAQFNLGLMYELGHGVSKDYAQSEGWYRKAAEQGEAHSQARLGGMYINGLGVPQDYEQAINWFRKAAEQGNVVAQTSLGRMYEKGQGTPQDYAQALVLYRKAAEQGEVMAQYNLGVLYYKGEGVTQDYAQATVWFRKASEQGNENAINFLPALEKKLAEQQATVKQTAEDEARGYIHMSFTDFRLDAKKMRLGSKLAISGLYQVKGEIETLAESLFATQMPNTFRVFLLTEDAPRAIRRKLLELRDGVCGVYGCQLTILGHVSKCEVTWLGAQVKSTTCISVDDIH